MLFKPEEETWVVDKYCGCPCMVIVARETTSFWFLCSACPSHYLASLSLKKGNITAWHKNRKQKRQKPVHYPVTYKCFSENLHDSDFWEMKNRISPLKLLYAYVLVTARYHIHTFKYAKTPISKPHLWAEESIMCQARTGQGLAYQRPKTWVRMVPCDLSEAVPGRQCDQQKGFYGSRFWKPVQERLRFFGSWGQVKLWNKPASQTRVSGVNKKKADICL